MNSTVEGQEVGFHMRVIAGERNTKRTFVVSQPPYPKVGEMLHLPDGSELVVKKVQRIKGPVFFVQFPRRANTVKPQPVESDEGSGKG